MDTSATSLWEFGRLAPRRSGGPLGSRDIVHTYEVLCTCSVAIAVGEYPAFVTAQDVFLSAEDCSRGIFQLTVGRADATPQCCVRCWRLEELE